MKHLAPMLLLAALWSLPGAAQTSYMKRADRFSTDSLGSGRNTVLEVEWIGRGERYARYETEEQGERRYWIVDMKSQRCSPMFDNRRMVELLKNPQS